MRAHTFADAAARAFTDFYHTGHKGKVYDQARKVSCQPIYRSMMVNRTWWRSLERSSRRRPQLSFISLHCISQRSAQGSMSRRAYMQLRSAKMHSALSQMSIKLSIRITLQHPSVTSLWASGLGVIFAENHNSELTEERTSSQKKMVCQLR